ncbi:peptidylprolyl isomerase [Desulfotomaculum copahuensis]|uniref:PpiC domain-containing protein n=1 Tax=Desulfotomaculum copahuensis TaxID=1838280 RepID=A0A1B7LCS4_9FIRM|nr:peptidylprolyl isomerase [Desulfotomaculum copahuensis]OAT80673.1 hypothetical protein A6M21_13135 [Desulfotomaculum copahuensis]
MRLKKWLPLIMLAVLALLAAGCANSNVAATVNGKEISMDQLNERVNANKDELTKQGYSFSGPDGQKMTDLLRQRTLEQMIDEQLLVQEADKEKLKPSPAEVAKQIKTLRQQLGSEAKFKQYLAANGLSEPKLQDELTDLMAIQALQNKVLADVKPATAAQAQDYYNQHKDQFSTPEQWQVRHILITVPKQGDLQAEAAAKAEALSIIQKLQHGADFAALAKQYSQDPGTKDSGGLYTFAKGQAVPEFEKAVQALKPGEITAQPVKTQYGYHVIKLEKIIPAQVKSFDQVKDQIMANLTDQARKTKFQEFLDGLRKNARIVNNLAPAKTKQ